VKVGDLVRFRFSSDEAGNPSLVGLVVETDRFLYLDKAYVKWNPTQLGSNKLLWENVDELEVISEGR